MANTTFRATLVLLFIVAVAHGRRSTRQDQQRQEDFVDKTLELVRSNVNNSAVRYQDQDIRDQTVNRREHDEDRRNQDYRREIYQRTVANEDKYRSERRDLRQSYQTLRQDPNYRRERNQDRRDQDYENRVQDEDRRALRERYQDRRNQDDERHLQDDDRRALRERYRDRRDQDQERRFHNERRYQDDDRRALSERYQNKRDQNQDRRDQHDDRGTLRERYQNRREHQDDYQRERNQDRRERQDDYQREISQDGKENEENHGAEGENPKRRLRNQNKRERYQDLNEEQVKGDVEKRRQLYRERRREQELRKITDQVDNRHRQQDVMYGDNYVLNQHLRHQDEDRRLRQQDRNYDRSQHQGPSPHQLFFLGLRNPPPDSWIDLQGKNKNELEIKPQQSNIFDLQNKKGLRDQIVVYDDVVVEDPRRSRRRRDIQDQVNKTLVNHLRNQNQQYRVVLSPYRYYNSDLYPSPNYNNREYSNGNGAPSFKYNLQRLYDDETRYLVPVEAPVINDLQSSYGNDDAAALQGNYFVENLQLNELPVRQILNVV